ncbi:MAG: putative cystine transporter YijE [Rhodocyclaceae bacterium]|nr:MAG: EamA family transporter [Rhodocyclaceae bacterium]MBE7422464.1 EamA family transporter [Zoogloeaceae bacterium]MBV6408090.1 putative cystine transporter YijE [Rhodocyclaceae bacterium]MCK6382822.1 DMT family transporter [Rhodocyclaceae bacterium]CAG0933276.1 putative cystine transporter YijE [Rhodocyclaceae bacterium]
MTEERAQLSRFGLLLLALLALGWGLNWPIMKIVLRDMPPLTFRGSCLLLGGLGVMLIGRLDGQPWRIPPGAFGKLLLLSATNMIGWNVLMIYGVGLMPSGRAALLGYTMPLWSLAFSVWLLGERLNSRRVAGLVLGLAGVAALMGSSLGQLGAAPLGVLCMLGAAMTWGLGVVLLKRFALQMPTTQLTAWIMLIGSVPIGAAAVLFESGDWRAVGLGPALGFFYNLTVAFMFCYWAWNRIVLMVPVAVSSLSALVTPVIGVLGGMWLLGEQPGWSEFFGAMLILGALATVLLPQRK